VVEVEIIYGDICIFCRNRNGLYMKLVGIEIEIQSQNIKSVSGKGNGSVKKIPLLTLVHFYCSHPSRGYTFSLVSSISRVSH
jgi:hypothetical protein